MDKETGKSKGFGFIEMQNREEGLEAVESLNDISLGKKPLVVKEAEERSTPRPSAGGFNRNNDRDSFNDRRR